MTEVKYVSESIPAHGKVRVLMRDGKWECGEDERQLSYAEWCERVRLAEPQKDVNGAITGAIEVAEAALQPPATRPWGSL